MSEKGKGRAAEGQASGEETPGNFVREVVESDLASGRHDGRLVTRFPPEPNGYLHIGHAKSIALNFGLADLAEGGVCNLRFDDTNPAVEEVEYVESIEEDVRWLGHDWGERRYFASDYFPQLFEFAMKMVREGKAYVDSQSTEAIREGRGDFHRPGVNSPHRDRPVAENVDLFERMRAGEFDDGAHVLRAKGEMGSKDLKMRDPLMYRIRKISHHRTGDAWPIYPMYDFAHGQSDAIEGVTHSVCTLEFQNHRPLYEWFHEQLEVKSPPRQVEFARLNLTYTVLSKRKLNQLVTEGHVAGWNDPRMPTLAGLRRRGYTPAAIRAFCERIGVSRRDSFVDVSLLEHALREDLNATSPRVMGVLRPLKVVLTNMDEDALHLLDVPFSSEEPSWGSRQVPLTRELWVERDDFAEEPPKKWFRLAPGKEVRLRNGCLITCEEVVKDPESGEVLELRCSWDPESLGGNAPDGRRVRGTLHWVSAAKAVEAEVRLYDRLFDVENPLDEKHERPFSEFLSETSLEIIEGAKLEPYLADVEPGARVQFERIGYFCVDSVDSKPGALVFNRTIALRDSWGKKASKKGK